MTPSHPPVRGYLLFGHGARNPEWAQPMEAARQALQRRIPNAPVSLAFLEFLTPTLEEALTALATQCTEVVIVPWFIAPGGHLLRDLPKLIEPFSATHPQVQVICLEAIGTWPEVIEAMAEAVIGRSKD